jgi:hypothetical protein
MGKRSGYRCRTRLEAVLRGRISADGKVIAGKGRFEGDKRAWLVPLP